MIGGGLKLYTKDTSSIKMEDKGSNTVIPFYDHHKIRLVETMTFWAEWHGGFLKDLVPMSILSGRIHILFAQTH